MACGQSKPDHNHEGYNIGLLLAQGELFCACDSDAVVPLEFVRSIFHHFMEDPLANAMKALSKPRRTFAKQCGDQLRKRFFELTGMPKWFRIKRASSRARSSDG